MQKFSISNVHGCILCDSNVQLWQNVLPSKFLCASASSKLVTTEILLWTLITSKVLSNTWNYAFTKKCNTVLWTRIRSLSRIHWRWVTENGEKSDRQQYVPQRRARGARRSIFYASCSVMGGCKNSYINIGFLSVYGTKWLLHPLNNFSF